MKAIGYIRVSTDKQVQDGVSLDNQRQQIESYCRYKGIELVSIVEDAGISGGKNAAREGFCALLDALESRSVDVLVIYSLERLSRDMLTLLSFERLLSEYDIELHTIQGAVDTSTPAGWLSFAVNALMSENERRVVKARTKAAMQYKKSQSAVVGAIPYGFKREGDKLIEDSEEQAIIARVNTMHTNGMNLAEIARSLETAGVMTRAGKAFDHSQVKRIIKGYECSYHHKQSEIGGMIREFLLKVA
jgi:site-specific DNA recombinase